MADTLTEKWVYPPNWNGNPPESGGWRTVVKRFTCLSDGVAETGVTKVDISDLRNLQGVAPTRTVVESIKYAQEGFTSVTLYWDRNPSELIYRMPVGQGEIDFTKSGGLVDSGEAGDGTGDIILSSVGATSGDMYDITIKLRLK